MIMLKYIYACALLALVEACEHSDRISHDEPISFSGIYPHLAMYNEEDECGTGAVVPWAGSLWVLTYAPHKPLGSSDKLYEISPDLDQIIRGESVGGTPANRMIHQESEQLFIGPYAIDKNKNVRVIPYGKMKGRHTGNARHLSDPEGKIYYATMEEGFYEVDVATLEPTILYRDLHNDLGKKVQTDPDDPLFANLPGAHGKGLYSGQGVVVYSNNGEDSPLALEQFDIESGVLAEWDGSNWKVIQRNQFVEVTGPGGIYGNAHAEADPIWTTGWDHKSAMVGVRNKGQWTFYRIPKASHSYDGAHGWNTEWPRIRNVGTGRDPDYLMTMHGMFWRFPQHFAVSTSAGIRPRSAYLKVIGDFARWNDHLVLGCDDSALKEFLNKRKVKGDIEGPGQSNSNLWFLDPDMPDRLGPSSASGALWLQEEVDAQVPSDPYLFAGWDHKSVWFKNHGSKPVVLSSEVDRLGQSDWELLKEVKLGPGESKRVEFSEDKAEWIRLVSDTKSKLTAVFTYSTNENRDSMADSLFSGIVKVDHDPITGGLLYGLGDNRKALGLTSRYRGKRGGYYELDGLMHLELKEDSGTQTFIENKFAIPKDVITVESSSVLVIDDKGRRWRLPRGSSAFDSLINHSKIRLSREVATERDLFNCHGTFYELPAENADGFAKIRPVSSHNFRIQDYASYRGLLVLTGIDPAASAGNSHVILSKDKRAAVWVGVIDDLWKMGKPRGHGGPWLNTRINAREPSDPYLIGFYDKKQLQIRHAASVPIQFTIEVEPLGHGPWMTYQVVTVPPGETFSYTFPEGFHARWIRFTSDRDCEATAWLEYF